MARIRQYQPQTEAATGWLPQPEARPDDFGAGIGRGLSAIGGALEQGAGVIAEAKQRQETLDVFTKTEMLDAQKRVQFAELAAKATPGDMSFADKFMESLSNDLSAVGDNISTPAGRAAHQRATAQIMAEYTQRAGQTGQHLAGVKAVSDARAGLDAMSAGLVTDPGQFQSKLTTLNGLLDNRDGPFGNIPSDKRDEFARVAREQLASSAMKGRINQNPERALRDLQSGAMDQYLTGAMRSALEDQAERGVRVKEAEVLRLDARREKAERAAERATEGALFKKLVADPNGVSAEEVAKSNLPPSRKDVWLGRVTRIAKEGDKETNAQTFLEIARMIDERKITNIGQLDDEMEAKARSLSVAAQNTLRSRMIAYENEAARRETADLRAFEEGAKRQITRSTPFVTDPQGDAQYAQWLIDFHQQYEAGRAAGKTARQLLSVKSPDYLGHTVRGYARSPNEIYGVDTFGRAAPTTRSTPNAASQAPMAR